MKLSEMKKGERFVYRRTGMKGTVGVKRNGRVKVDLLRHRRKGWTYPACSIYLSGDTEVERR